MPITKMNSKRDFFRIWFLRKKQAIILFFLIIFAIMLYAYTCTPIYETSAKILLLPRTSDAEVISATIQDNQLHQISQKDLYSEMELITSEPVLEATVTSFKGESLGLSIPETDKAWYYKFTSEINQTVTGILRFLRLKEQSIPKKEAMMAEMKNRLSTDAILDSNVIFVNLRAEQPEAGAEVLNRLLQKYLEYRERVFTQEQGYVFFSEQAQDYRVKLEQAEKKLKDFQRRNSIVNLETQNQANIDLLSDFIKQLRNLEISYAAARERIDSLKRHLKTNEAGLVLTEKMREIPGIIELEKGIVPLLIRRSEINKNFTTESREYQDINNQINMIRGEIRLEINKAIETEELELESLKTKKDTLSDKIDQLQEQTIQFNQMERSIKELQREIALYQKNFNHYSSKTEDARIYREKSKRNLTNVSLASKANPPATPTYPNRLLILGLSIFFGLLAALFWPFLAESLDTRLKTIEGVESLTTQSVITSFPEIKK